MCVHMYTDTDIYIYIDIDIIDHIRKGGACGFGACGRGIDCSPMASQSPKGSGARAKPKRDWGLGFRVWGLGFITITKGLGGGHLSLKL